MFGNVREWCWEWYSYLEILDNIWRVSKGGGWVSSVNIVEIFYLGKFDVNGIGFDQGL